MTITWKNGGRPVNKDRLASLASKYYPRLFRAAYFMTGNREDAEDLVQDTFEQAVRSIDNYRGDSRFYTWIYGIMRHVGYRKRRSKKLFVNRGGSLVELEEARENTGDGDPHDLSVRSETSLRVHRALMKLPDKYREVMMLRHFEDFTYEEIAGIVDCPVGTVRSRLFKARNLLRKKLGEL